MTDYDRLIEEEKAAFDRQADERIRAGFVPDLRRLVPVDWFYNNVWRDPRFVEIHWMPRIRRIIDHARSSSGTKVLELGCGYGMLSLECARNGLDVVGVDLSPVNIRIAERFKAENPFTDGFGSLTYRCGDISQMDFEPAAFDSVIFFRSLHHIPQAESVLEKVARALKYKGKLIVSEPIRGHFDSQSAHFAAVLRAIAPTWIGYDEKLQGKWSSERWENQVQEIYGEYALEEAHSQSPLDNSVKRAEELVRLVERRFDVIEKTFSDAFIDKLIGGLRGECRYELARFLKFLDDYMVQNRLLPPTSIELVAAKKSGPK